MFLSPLLIKLATVCTGSLFLPFLLEFMHDSLTPCRGGSLLIGAAPLQRPPLPGTTPRPCVGVSPGDSARLSTQHSALTAAVWVCLRASRAKTANMQLGVSLVLLGGTV